MNHPRGSSMDPPAEWFDSANDLVSFVLFHFWTKFPAFTRCGGWGWAPVGSPPQQGCSLLPSAGRGGGSATISAPQPRPELPPAPLCEEGKPRPLPSAWPSPRESRGSGSGRCRLWESNRAPGGGIQVSQAQTLTPQGRCTTPSLLAPGPPIAPSPSGRGRAARPWRVSDIVFFLEMEALLPATWQASPGPGSWDHFGECRWRPGTCGLVGVAGRQAGSAARRALLPAVEFFRVFFSHHVEPVCNGSILEGKGTESRLLVSGPDPVQCGRDTHFHGSSQMSGETREVPAQRLDTRSQARGEGPPAVRADARWLLLMFTLYAF